MFKAPGSQFFTPLNGRYIGEFIGVSEGPMMKDFGAETESPRVKWSFTMSNIDGSVLIDPATGEQAIGEALTTTSTGDRSKALKWLKKLMEAKGLTYTPHKTEEDFMSQLMSTVGAKVALMYGPNQKGKTALQEIEVMIFAPTATASASITAPFPAAATA